MSKLRVIQKIGARAVDSTITASISASNLKSNSISAGTAWLGPNGGLFFTTDNGLYNGRIGFGTLTPQYSQAIDVQMPIYFNDPVYVLSGLDANTIDSNSGYFLSLTSTSISTQGLTAVGTISANVLYIGNIYTHNIYIADNLTANTISSNTISAGIAKFTTIIADNEIFNTLSATNFTANSISALSITASNTLSANLTLLGNTTANNLFVNNSISATSISANSSKLNTLLVNNSISSATISSGDINVSKPGFSINSATMSVSANSVSGGQIVGVSVSAHTISGGASKFQSISSASFSSGAINISQPKMILNSANGAISGETISANAGKFNSLLVNTSVSANSISAGDGRITNLTSDGIIRFNSLSGNNLTANNITFISTTAIEFVTTGSMNIAGSLDVTGSSVMQFIARFNDSNSAEKVLITNDGDVLLADALTANSISAYTISGGIGKFNNLFVNNSLSANILLAGNFMVSTASLQNQIDSLEGATSNLLSRINSVDSGTASNLAQINILNGVQANYAVLSGFNIFTNSNSISASSITAKNSISANTISAGNSKFTNIIALNSISSSTLTTNNIYLKESLIENEYYGSKVIGIGTYTTSANQVAYIVFPNMTFHGLIKVSVIGTWANLATFGSLSRKFSIYKNINGTSISQYYSEIDSAMGDVAQKIRIEDAEVDQSISAILIPINKIVEANGSTIRAKVEIFSGNADYVEQMLGSMSARDFTTITGYSTSRQHVFLDNSNFGIQTDDPLTVLHVAGAGSISSMGLTAIQSVSAGLILAGNLQTSTASLQNQINSISAGVSGNYVPYTGAINGVNLASQSLTASTLSSLIGRFNNVGISVTATPTKQLEIHNNTGTAYLRISTSGGSYTDLYNDGNFHIDGAPAGDFLIFSGNAGGKIATFRADANQTSDMAVIYTNGNMTISGSLTAQNLTAAGTGSFAYVGIGTNSPITYLHVSPPVANNRLARFQDSGGHGIDIDAWINGVNIDPISASDTIYFGRDLALGKLIIQTGNVGIGTITPLAHLHVTGSISATNLSGNGHILLTPSTANDFYMKIIAQGESNATMKIWSPTQKWKAVGDKIQYEFPDHNHAILATWAEPWRWYCTDPIEFITNDASDYIAFRVMNGNVLSATTTSSKEVLRIQTDGKIGVGTSSAMAHFHVTGSISALSLTTAGIISVSGGTFYGSGAGGDTVADAAIVMPYGKAIYGYTTNNISLRKLLYIDTSGNIDIGQIGTILIPSINLKAGAYGYVTFNVGGKEILRALSTGNVGIGTSSPLTTLHITGSLSAASVTSFSSVVKRNNNDAILTLENSGHNNTSGIDFRRERNDGTNVNGASIFINSNTSSTEALLYLQAQSTTVSPGLTSALVNSNGVRLILRGGHGQFLIETGDNERMRILANGYMGLGTSSPLAHLHVTGSISAMSLTTAGGYIRGTGASPYIRLDQSNGTELAYGTNLIYLTSSDIRFRPSNVERVKIDSIGLSALTISAGTIYSPNSVSANTISAGTARFTNLYTDNETFGSLSADGFTANTILARTSISAGSISTLSDITVGLTSSANIYFGDIASYLRRDNSYDLSLQQISSSNNGLYLGSAGDVVVAIDSNNNDTSKRFIIGKDATKPTTALFSVNENGNATVSGSLSSGSISTLGDVNIVGELYATVKHFRIEDKENIGHTITYGALEGRENAVYTRGKIYTNKNTFEIPLPREWNWLVDIDSITVQLTPIGHSQKLSYLINKDKVVVKNNNSLFNKKIHCSYIIFGTRKDVKPLEVYN
ncbi:MAG: beta strand repeat-containing protein [Paludibacter sp.]